MTSNFVTFSKPFIDATINVFKTMVFTEVTPQKPDVKKTSRSQGDVSAVLGLSGEVEKNGEVKPYKAQLVISWPYETYLKCASAMLMEEYEEFTDDISDVGGEICNMIMGNAKRDLGTLGYTSNMAIPTMIEGKGHNIKYPEGVIVILVPIESDHGPFFLEICYKEV